MPDGRLIFNVAMLAADTENYPCPHPFRLKVFKFRLQCQKHGTIRVINISQNDKTEQSDTFMNK